jgi:uncharacterized membrane protein YbhN (UPF0104 family)
MSAADKRRARFGRAVVSVVLLAAIFAWVDPAAVVAQVRGVSPGWLAAALAASALQFALSAERWRRTAGSLGVPLARRRALADYYLAGFGNQVLPGGVAGDAARAWRHSHTSGRPGPAVRAVVLERASGQAVVALSLAAVLAFTDTGERLLAALSGDRLPGAAALAAATVVLAGLAVAIAGRAGRLPGWLAVLVADAKRSLLARRAWPAQLALSLAVLGTCCVMFACAGRVIGVETPFGVLAAIAPAVLVAMLVPVSVAGWGVREFAAAGIWTALGWPAAEGVAISITYGVLCLLGSLPGALVAAAEPIRRRG